MGILVNRMAPDFTAPAVTGEGEIIERFTMSETLKNKFGLIFFYPLDFTFVCPSELIALDHKMDEFKKRNIEAIAVSVDSQYTHFAWRNTPVNQGGIGPVKYTLVADVNHSISQKYNMLHSEESGVALRGAFIIDTKRMVRAEIVHDLPFGRNIEEILRVFDAVEFCDKHGEVCPAGWHKGEKGMKATPSGVADYLATKGKEL